MTTEGLEKEVIEEQTKDKDQSEVKPSEKRPTQQSVDEGIEAFTQNQKQRALLSIFKQLGPKWYAVAVLVVMVLPTLVTAYIDIRNTIEKIETRQEEDSEEITDKSTAVETEQIANIQELREKMLLVYTDLLTRISALEAKLAEAEAPGAMAPLYYLTGSEPKSDMPPPIEEVKEKAKEDLKFRPIQAQFEE